MAKFNWEAYLEDLIEMRKDKKSLADMVDYIKFRTGKVFTKGRISQVLKPFGLVKEPTDAEV